jgi:hypothetical protein
MVGIALQRDRFAAGSQYGQRVCKADGFVELDRFGDENMGEA